MISLGDPVNDANQRNKFVEAYAAKHQIENESDKKAVLIFGVEDWPFPVPLIKKTNGWQFDTATSLKEILFRRIGHDELDTITGVPRLCRCAERLRSDDARESTGVAAYAQRIVSQEGKKDGLYWPTQPGEAPRPLRRTCGARNVARLPRRRRTRALPRLLLQKILTRQGSAAPGGAYDYVVRGNMIGPTALVAYPAAYRNSGVMTFLVNHDGTVFQKDFGPRTARLAEEMT